MKRLTFYSVKDMTSCLEKGIDIYNEKYGLYLCANKTSHSITAYNLSQLQAIDICRQLKQNNEEHWNSQLDDTPVLKDMCDQNAVNTYLASIYYLSDWIIADKNTYWSITHD